MKQTGLISGRAQDGDRRRAVGAAEERGQGNSKSRDVLIRALISTDNSKPLYRVLVSEGVCCSVLCDSLRPPGL